MQEQFLYVVCTEAETLPVFIGTHTTSSLNFILYLLKSRFEDHRTNILCDPRLVQGYSILVSWILLQVFWP